MKFYIAGKFEEVARIHEVYKQVEALGHEVSYDWTTHIKSKPYEEHIERISTYAMNELEAILDSGVFVYLTHERGTTLHMEYGAALAKKQSGGDITIFAVGPHNNRSPWYFTDLVERVDTIEDVFIHLNLTTNKKSA